MKKNYVKFVIDILMAVTFVLLFNKMVFGGLLFHEVAGIGIGLGTLIHILLNLRWVKNITVRLFDRKLPGKTRLGYFLNILLLISMGFIIVSGLAISKELFPQLNIGNEAWFKIAHISISYLTIMIIGIHLGLHWNWVMSHFIKIFNIKTSKITPVIAKVGMVVVLMFGSFEMVSENYFEQVARVSTVFSITNSQMANYGIKQRTEGIKQRSEVQASGAQHAGKEGRTTGFQSPSPLDIITQYSAIMGVFIILTYYMEKLLTPRKRFR